MKTRYCLIAALALCLCGAGAWAQTCNDVLIDLGSMGCGDVLTASGDNTGAVSFCRHPSGDVHYSFTVTEAGKYSISTCGSGFSMIRLELYDDTCCGNQIAWGYSNCGNQEAKIIEDLTPGTYYILVEGNSTTEGAFTLTITCLDVIDLGSMVCGDMLTASGDNTGAVSFCGQSSGDVHYSFTVTEAGKYSMSTCGSGFSMIMLRLYDDTPCGNQITYGYSNCGNVEAQIVEDLTPGTYYIHVEGSGTTEGAFTLNITCLDVIDLGPVGADTLAHSDDNTGKASFCSQWSGDVHYSFTVTEAATHTMSTCGSGFSMIRLWLYDDAPCGNQIAHGYGNCGNVEAEIVEDLTPGTYYLLVEGNSSTEGPYTVSIFCDGCAPVTATESSSWGRVKKLFR